METLKGVLLSRKKLIKFKSKLPDVVLLELAKFICLHIQKDKLKSNSNYKRHITYYIQNEKEKYSSDLADVAYFINCDLELTWDFKSLSRAYNNVFRFYENKQYENVNSNFKYGPITPPQPENIDLLIAYGACVYFEIDGLLDIDLNNMETVLRSYLNNSQYSLQKRIVSNINSYSKRDLFILDYGVKKETNVIDYEVLNTLIRKPIKVPYTNYEAIVCAAIHYQIDLTKKDRPLLLYKNIIEDPKFRNFCTNLTKFNPKLSLLFYDLKTLKTILLLMGYSGVEIADSSKLELYQMCIENYILNNFKHGLSENRINDKTSIYLRDVNSLRYDETVRYGTSIDGYIIYTYREILGTFNAYNGFFRPDDLQNTFTDHNIKKLLMLCSKKKYPEERKYKYRAKLCKKINQMQSILKTNSPSVQTLIDFHKNNDLVITTALKLLTYVAMSMRGWIGFGPYPIKNTLVDDQEKVNVSVLDKLKELLLYLETEKIGDVVFSLPLVGYTNGTFYDNIVVEKGINIGDRMRILEDFSNVNSCIRTTSNWLLSSIYKYSLILKINPGFDIDKVRKIG